MSHALHLPFAAALTIAIVSMALKDLLGTVMQVAESRGASKLAGHMDGLWDGASVICQAVGAGTVILTGFTWRSLVIIAAIMITSDIGTRTWTRLAARHVPEDPRMLALQHRIADLEDRMARSADA